MPFLLSLKFLMTSISENAIMSLLEQVADFQMTYFRRIGEESVDMKAAKETVSFVDVESEKMLFDGLAAICPEAGFFGEESGKSGDQDLVWIVDPLDGTTNYLNGVDHFSISVALVQNNEPIVGVVYKSVSREAISAVKGQGVKHNGSPILNSRIDIEAGDALFVTGFPYRSVDLNDCFFDAASRVLRLGRDIRRTGSAALDLAYLGVGWYGGFWESDLQPYDMAAAILIMSENGVIVTNHRGEPFHLLEDRLMVAAQPKVHQTLLEIIQSAYGSLG
jgi:myo-inositol-1(or 4)-monophosphatase